MRHQPARMIGGVTNGERAAAAGGALLNYAESRYENEEIPTVLGDLLCDMMHFLGAMGFDPETSMQQAIESGLAHYRAETGGEPHEMPDGELANEEPPGLDRPVVNPDEWMTDLRWREGCA